MAAVDSHPQDTDATRLRSDARRNREQILIAARQTFAERGIDAPISAIARRAGVGVATLYRRFPTRDALVTETFTEQFDRCTGVLDDALTAPDPWQGLCTLVHRICAMQVADRGFTEAFFSRYPDALEHAHLTRAEHGLDELVRRCQRNGHMRPDVSASDITLALVANAGLVARCPQPEHASARLIGQLLRAFTTDPNRPLPPPSALKLRPSTLSK